MSALRAAVVDFPLRPLLYTAVAASTAAGIYYYVKRRSREKTAGPEDTTEDSVCDQATEPAVVQPTEVPQDQVMDTVTILTLVVSNIQLQNRVKELEELLCEECRDCDMKSKVSLAEADLKFKKAVENIAQLKVVKSDLKNQVQTLQGTAHNMEHLLTKIRLVFDELENECEKVQEENKQMKEKLKLCEDLLMGYEKVVEENKEMKEKLKLCEDILMECEQEHEAEKNERKETLIHKEELLKVSLAEAEEKHQKAVETIAQLEVEKSDLKNQVETLHGIVKDMGNLLSKSEKECDELTTARAEEREAHSFLQSEYDKMKKTLMHMEELPKKHCIPLGSKETTSIETEVCENRNGSPAETT
ncbi:uncharacterized protein LOC128602066 isoform X1 [Ictalurus furcatus]|uniref:uncharacterized protein LOC128602066 isoform X1 n=1 Tax=Ictalurus furcatus TaxID=66913 RepID=UPI0023509A78|nr:uncharacterized protein LOC128602066 isoform X1 [Ictalurus furcatus]XP_053471581.1 uncharacterized protein LOC128602066 isoform X1 [Ictalurus furcatus]XP_053471590.1 uncharacterized protein LOC128602066 isoform X1 [Ictalurus furcatus]XP_053471600.1 uncharacterized protein LOC128602066 isoform X1 [Ictalurus furcatus]XP_053471606.1 uncharacterized protein LOC128602066 isoform X1 [Ictalurus furcatus]XP_053471615.1 uncharacterized protein LOC128602066 isoform X1 [Ictalurus furcatus]XP_05347162